MEVRDGRSGNLVREGSPIKTEEPGTTQSPTNILQTRIEETEEVQEDDLTTEFDDIWLAFLSFEEYYYDSEISSFTGFLTEWQKRLTSALDLGLTYSETVLCLKLLKNSRLDRRARASVFSSLQSRPDFLQANLLLFTLNALNGIKDEKEAAKFNVKSELLEDYPAPTVQLDLEQGLHHEEEGHLDLQEPEAFLASRDCDNFYEEGEEGGEGGNAYQCPECPMTCPRLQEFKAHELAHLGPAREYPCSSCTASYSSHKLRERHLVVHENKSRIKCDICGKEFFGERTIKYHMKNVHKKNLRCNFCPKLFDRQSKLSKHEETHVKRQINQEAMFQCDQCGKEVQGKKGLRIHKRTHFQFRCQPCNKIFKDQDLLNRHILNHQEYPCDQCGQIYYQLALLQKHKNTITHGGERKFACDQCGKTFMKNYNLQTHQLTHTGEKNYKCEFEECTMAFYKKDVMVRHMRIHTGEKPYQCDICERRFTQSGDMRKHRRTHGVD